jgi:uncharacterized protein YbjT (DUF2867 family)
MKAIIFGATGMIGEAALRECLRDPAVDAVLVVGRSPIGQSHPKLREIIHADFFDYSAIEADLTGYDACFFTLGVSSFRMAEDDYRRLTYDLTLAAATVLARLNPGMTFIYVSGRSTDSSERGSMMWARVKGRTENALMRLPFKAAYMFRPGAVQPMHGVISKTPVYRILYQVTGFLLPLLKRVAPNLVTASDQMGRAMIKVAQHGYRKPILEAEDINGV